jgi:superoxide reductase
MKPLAENTVDAAKEKHVPVIEKGAEGITIKVGSVAHPMEEKHYIEWIEAIVDGAVYRHFLKPGEAPEAFFPLKGDSVTASEYCNVHGLLKNYRRGSDEERKGNKDREEPPGQFRRGIASADEIQLFFIPGKEGRF